jgi:hypothetical protein
MASPTEGRRLAAQAEDLIARDLSGPPTADQRAAIDARANTALSLYPALKPIADRYGVSVVDLMALHTVETRGKGDPMGRTSPAGATGPFQITPITRKQYPVTQTYGTTFEADADIAAQHLAAAKKAGFSTFGGQALTYTAGMEGVKRWGGGGPSRVGQDSREYVPMAIYAKQTIEAKLPDYVKQLEREKKKAAADAGMKAFKESPYEKPHTDYRMFAGPYGVSTAEAEAARQARNEARDRAMAEAAAVPQTPYVQYGYK